MMNPYQHRRLLNLTIALLSVLIVLQVVSIVASFR